MDKDDTLKNKIPHNKPTIGDEEIGAVCATLLSQELTMGNKVKDFEEAFSGYMGISSVSTSSGTSALHLALIAIGISKYDEVIIPSYTCIAVALPIIYQQAKPILSDIKDDYNISVEDVESKINDKTKAVIVPHMFGYPADISEIKDLCRSEGIYLIEDCAQSTGALYDGKKVGTFGDLSIFSFYATKMMTSIQGGAVCTEDPDWIQTIRDLRYHDQCRSFEDGDPRIKYSYMMSDVGAVVGKVQLKKLDRFISRRREIASIYRDKIEGEVIHPPEGARKKHVYSRYLIRTSFNPSKIIERLQSYGIDAVMMHLPPLHNRILLKEYNKDAKFPMTDNVIHSAISFPIYPSLTDEEAIYVTEKINKTMEELQ
ncbi:MAG: DegT/DnrJ/EryC1/StrS family aminotransferase [Halobacteriota archaeon]|nr:DegT/DnrJ/EryC1/StrS family aminotransferase [Halobacteriota archaeon]